MLASGVAVVLVTACSAFAGLAALSEGGDTAARAVIFAPWLTGEEAIARVAAAGLPLLRQGRRPFIVIVASSRDAATAAARSRPPGAWFMLTLDGLAGCLDQPRATAS